MGTPLEPLVQRFYEERSAAQLAKVLGEARRIAERAAHATGMRDADVDDVAQHAATRLCAVLERPERVDRPDALVWRIAANRARDLHRQRARQGQRAARLERDPTIAGDAVPSPEEAYLHDEGAERAHELVRDALEAAPETYKRVIDLHFFRGVTIEDIAALYYDETASGIDASDPVAVHAGRKRARNRVDQHLTRGKRWLAQRLADALAREDA